MSCATLHQSMMIVFTNLSIIDGEAHPASQDQKRVMTMIMKLGRKAKEINPSKHSAMKRVFGTTLQKPWLMLAVLCSF